jgi:hypothetical protein
MRGDLVAGERLGDLLFRRAPAQHARSPGEVAENLSRHGGGPQIGSARTVHGPLLLHSMLAEPISSDQSRTASCRWASGRSGQGSRYSADRSGPFTRAGQKLSDSRRSSFHSVSRASTRRFQPASPAPRLGADTAAGLANSVGPTSVQVVRPSIASRSSHRNREEQRSRGAPPGPALALPGQRRQGGGRSKESRASSRGGGLMDPASRDERPFPAGHAEWPNVSDDAPRGVAMRWPAPTHPVGW